MRAEEELGVVLGKGTQRIERPRDGADDISNRFAPPYYVINSEVSGVWFQGLNFKLFYIYFFDIY